VYHPYWGRVRGVSMWPPITDTRRVLKFPGFYLVRVDAGHTKRLIL